MTGGTPGIPLFTAPGKLKNRFIAGLALMRALIGWPCKDKKKKGNVKIEF
jgi:hypothetical protein